MRHTAQLRPNLQFNGIKVDSEPSPTNLRFYSFFFFLGRASIYILRTAFGVDWSERIKIIYAGDDDTDEDAMMVTISSSKSALVITNQLNY